MESKVLNLNDENGKGNSKIFIESDGASLNIPTNFILANRPHCSKHSKMKDFVTGNPNVGKGSAGFSSVIILASIIAITGVIIAFLMLKY